MLFSKREKPYSMPLNESAAIRGEALSLAGEKHSSAHAHLD